MYPNTVAYKKGEKLSYYINQAAGYSDKAKKNKAFVVYMNGTVSKVKGSDKKAITPGAEIIIPTKDEANRVTWSELAQISTSVVSMATVVALLINTLSK